MPIGSDVQARDCFFLCPSKSITRKAQQLYDTITQLRRLVPSTPNKDAVYKLTCVCSTQLQGST